MEESEGKIWYDCSLILYLWVVFVFLWEKMEFAIRRGLYSIHSKKRFEVVWRVSQSGGVGYLDGTQGGKIRYFSKQYNCMITIIYISRDGCAVGDNRWRVLCT